MEAVNSGKLDKEICSALGVVRSTVHDTRKKYVEEGLKKALYDANHPGKERKLNGYQEAEVVALACTKAPKGHVRWTLDLLTEKVKDTIDVSIGRTAVYKVLLRNDTKPWLKKMWCIPKITSEFLKKLFDVLEVYERTYDPKYPVICIDEKLTQLIKDTMASIEGKAGKPKKVDYEYKRNGTCLCLSELNQRLENEESE